MSTGEWIGVISAGIGILALLIGLMVAMLIMLLQRIDGVRQHVDSAIAELKAEFKSEIAGLGDRLAPRISQTELEQARLSGRFDGVIDILTRQSPADSDEPEGER